MRRGAREKIVIRHDAIKAFYKRMEQEFILTEKLKKLECRLRICENKSRIAYNILNTAEKLKTIDFHQKLYAKYDKLEQDYKLEPEFGVLRREAAEGEKVND